MKSIVLIAIILLIPTKNLICQPKGEIKEFQIQIVEYKNEIRHNFSIKPAQVKYVRVNLRFKFNLIGEYFTIKRYKRIERKTGMIELDAPRIFNTTETEKKYRNKIHKDKINEFIKLFENVNSYDNWDNSESLFQKRKEKLNAYLISGITTNNDTFAISKHITRQGLITPWEVEKGHRYVESKEIDSTFLKMFNKRFIGIKRLKKTL